MDEDKFEKGILNERYQFQGKLGEGQSSAVYTALDKNTDTEVVVKVLPKGFHSNESFRIETEALK